MVKTQGFGKQVTSKDFCRQEQTSCAFHHGTPCMGPWSFEDVRWLDGFSIWCPGVCLEWVFGFSHSKRLAKQRFEILRSEFQAIKMWVLLKCPWKTHCSIIWQQILLLFGFTCAEFLTNFAPAWGICLHIGLAHLPGAAVLRNSPTDLVTVASPLRHRRWLWVCWVSSGALPLCGSKSGASSEDWCVFLRTGGSWGIDKYYGNIWVWINTY